MKNESRNLIRALILMVALAVGAGIGALLPSNANANPGWTPECAPTLVLALDGTKGPRTPTSIDPKSPLNRVTAPYRMQPDTIVEHIAYPGGMIAGSYGWSESYNQSVEIGKSNLRQRIAENEALCGNHSRYILIGYSQGARVVGDVASEIDSDRITDDGTDLQDRIRVELYSDPRQPITGIEVVLAGSDILPGVTLSGPRPPFHNVNVNWICIPGDGVCDAHAPVDISTLIGYMTNHSSYGK
jgi:cutinase